MVLPQLLWFPRLRRNVAFLFAASLFIQVGMWSERFVIVVGSLHRDFLPSSWGGYAPSLVDLTLLVGSICFFLFLFLLFLRLVPCVAISELKELKRRTADGEAA